MRALAEAALAAGGLTASAVLAQPADTSAGEAIYSRYCATCHGESGRGDGPTAAVLLVPPADLSVLTRTSQGVFPAAEILRRVDGRDAILAHGSPMPIYGAFFDGGPVVPVETDAGTVAVSQPLLEILEYLRTLQQ